MTATDVIEKCLKEQSLTKNDLANRLNTSKQNISNKFSRDNFSESELVEICAALGYQLAFVDGNKVAFVIDGVPLPGRIQKQLERKAKRQQKDTPPASE